MLSAGDHFRRTLMRTMGPSLARRRQTLRVFEGISQRRQRYLFTLAITRRRYRGDHRRHRRIECEACRHLVERPLGRLAGLADHRFARRILVTAAGRLQRCHLGTDARDLLGRKQLAYLREQVLLLFLVVVLSLFAQHLELRPEGALLRIDLQQVREQPLERQVLLERLEQDVLGASGAHRRIEHLLLGTEVDRQLVADPAEQPSALFRVRGL